jgi:hypothetical protein
MKLSQLQTLNRKIITEEFAHSHNSFTSNDLNSGNFNFLPIEILDALEVMTGWYLGYVSDGEEFKKFRDEQEVIDYYAEEISYVKGNYESPDSDNYREIYVRCYPARQTRKIVEANFKELCFENP